MTVAPGGRDDGDAAGELPDGRAITALDRRIRHGVEIYLSTQERRRGRARPPLASIAIVAPAARASAPPEDLERDELVVGVDDREGERVARLGVVDLVQPHEWLPLLDVERGLGGCGLGHGHRLNEGMV